MPVPTEFCWTRFGTESGERIEAIFERKEQERRNNGGVFLWGIGNSVRPSLAELVKHEPRPSVVFSPMRSKPARADASPAEVLLWTSAVGLDGVSYALPHHSVVTSAVRGDRLPRVHYALVCSSDSPIDEVNGSEVFRYSDLRNWSNGTAIGASQVTCVVRRERTSDDDGSEYRAALVATLCPPYFVRLGAPRRVPEELRLDRLVGSCWLRASEALAALRSEHATRDGQQCFAL